MAAILGEIIADFSTTLNLKTAIWATSATLDSATDDDGVALPTGTYFLTLDRKSANKEYIKCTLTGTALTNIYHVSRQGTLTSGTTKTHRKGATVEITDFAIIKKMLDLLDGTTNFDSSVTLGYDGTATISNDNEFATKAYVDATATGTTNINRVVIAGNAGDTVAAGNLLYLDTDWEWKLCDADTATTVDNIILGIAQGAGTDWNTITGGVLTYGLDSNQTGLTANAIYYASNTAWGISSSAGTTEVTVGVARSTTSLFFDPRYNQQITEDIQDALAGTSGTPSSTNKYVTNDDTATAATADKVARRLAGGNITVVTESANNNSTNAASTEYVDRIAPKFLSWNFTQNANATTTTTIAHWFGRSPIGFMINWVWGSGTVWVQSNGSYDGTNNKCNFRWHDTNGALGGTDKDSTAAVWISYGSSTGSGLTRYVKWVVTWDDTNVTITWTAWSTNSSLNIDYSYTIIA